MDWKLKQKEGTVFSDLVALCGSSNCDKMWLTFCVTIYAKFISPVFGCKTLFWSEILSKVSLGKFFVVQAVERIILGQSFIQSVAKALLVLKNSCTLLYLSSKG